MYGLFTYIWWIFPVNESKYASPMDPQGMIDFIGLWLMIVGRWLPEDP